ncbi:hypothetical protein BB14905_14405 [Bacillus sp. B14905]|nr:hypothetical protein BB14905_14405 [Bacillus sp. B14905]
MYPIESLERDQKQRNVVKPPCALKGQIVEERFR